MHSKRQKPTRRSHFTPVLYLENFADASRVLHAISCVDGRRFESSPEGLGFERDLYRPDDLAEGEDPNKYEDVFRQFEGAAAPVIQGIVARRRMPTNDEQLGLLFNFIACQAVRVPTMRKLIAAPREHEARIIMDLVLSSREMWESHMRRAGYNPTEHSYEEMKAGVENDAYDVRLTTEGFLEGAMAMMNAILEYLHRRSWSILLSDRPGEQFVVSDHPVALTWSDGRDTRFGPGHAHLRTDLTFPVSSSVALLARYEPFEPISWASKENVAAINAKTVNEARRFVAASSDQFIVATHPRSICTADEFIADLKPR